VTVALKTDAAPLVIINTDLQRASGSTTLDAHLQCAGNNAHCRAIATTKPAMVAAACMALHIAA
jgi:hypothetical protein